MPICPILPHAANLERHHVESRTRTPVAKGRGRCPRRPPAGASAARDGAAAPALQATAAKPAAASAGCVNGARLPLWRPPGASAAGGAEEGLQEGFIPGMILF